MIAMFYPHRKCEGEGRGRTGTLLVASGSRTLISCFSCVDADIMIVTGGLKGNSYHLDN